MIGGVGIGRIDSVAGVCELQKMYCLPEARGTGAAHALMKTALAYARKHYCRCYLETLENMVAAQKFYEKYGFRRIAEPLVETGHYAMCVTARNGVQKRVCGETVRCRRKFWQRECNKSFLSCIPFMTGAAETC